jgi:hypothetical protein
MDATILQAQAERAALRLILSNVVAHLAAMEDDPTERQARLSKMKDQCRLAAEHTMNNVPGADWARVVDQIIQNLDDFFRSITIT